MTLENTNDRWIVFKKFRRSARFDNSARLELERADLDEHLKARKEKKCDHFLRDDGRAWLIELKGGHFEDAIPQIASTASLMEKEIGNREVIPVVVAQDCPAAAIQVKYLKQLKAAITKNIGSPVIRSGTASIKL